MRNDFFPETGSTDDQAILKDLAGLHADDLTSDGHAFAFIYDAGTAVNDLARKAFAAGMSGNGLDPTVYPSARRLENDLVGACLHHLGAPEGAVGTATSGGTESVILSVKTARDYARKTRPEITKPNMLVPETAHASFQKAAHYLYFSSRTSLLRISLGSALTCEHAIPDCISIPQMRNDSCGF